MQRIRGILKESFNLPQNIIIDEGCAFQDLAYNHVNGFANFCKENLGLPNLPKIHIVAVREGGMTTGAYDPQTHEILVYGKGRALADVLRTLAHELTHYRQRLQDKIKSSKRDWNLEGEADAEAGKMVYTYAYGDAANKQIYEL